eukprot:GSA120T00025284001.1
MNTAAGKLMLQSLQQGEMLSTSCTSGRQSSKSSTTWGGGSMSCRDHMYSNFGALSGGPEGVPPVPLPPPSPPSLDKVRGSSVLRGQFLSDHFFGEGNNNLNPGSSPSVVTGDAVGGCTSSTSAAKILTESYVSSPPVGPLLSQHKFSSEPVAALKTTQGTTSAISSPTGGTRNKF